jgi:two-component sensor histidine kinase
MVFKKTEHFMVVVVSVFVLLAVVMSITAIYSNKTLMAARAYVAGEGHWTKAQKDATLMLAYYIVTDNDTYYTKAIEKLQVNRGDKVARITLSSDNPDIELARQGFLQGNNPPEDVEYLIWMFLWFKDISYMKEAIDIWEAADAGIDSLEALANVIHSDNSDARLTEERVYEYLILLRELNVELTALEVAFSYQLQRASHWANTLTQQITIVGNILVILFVAIFTIAFLRRTQKKSEFLGTSLRQRELLLSEIHHRVKNNLAIVSSLLSLQAENTQEAEAIEVLNKSQARITSISDVHEMLYKTDNFSDISLKNYIETMFSRIASLYSGSDRIDLILKCEDIDVSSQKGVSLGLLLNELITNSFKHAFNSHDDGKIYLDIGRSNNGLSIAYRDNGFGAPEGKLDGTDASGSIGLLLINALLAQLEATVDWEQSEKGFSLKFSFPDEV